jgi:carbamoylphosphate synthase large subunit
MNPNISQSATIKDDGVDIIIWQPITQYEVAKAVQKQHIDGIIVDYDGQKALNCVVELDNSGFLKA